MSSPSTSSSHYSSSGLRSLRTLVRVTSLAALSQFSALVLWPYALLIAVYIPYILIVYPKPYITKIPLRRAFLVSLFTSIAGFPVLYCCSTWSHFVQTVQTFRSLRTKYRPTRDAVIPQCGSSPCALSAEHRPSLRYPPLPPPGLFNRPQQRLNSLLVRFEAYC